MAYGNKFGNRNQADAVAFMVEHEGEKGPYWKGYADLGAGKGMRLMMFENHKEGAKSAFVVQIWKKSYSEQKRKTW